MSPEPNGSQNLVYRKEGNLRSICLQGDRNICLRFNTFHIQDRGPQGNILQHTTPIPHWRIPPEKSIPKFTPATDL